MRPDRKLLEYHHRQCWHSSWRPAFDYLKHGAAEVVARHAADAPPASNLLRAVAASAPQSAWTQFLAERRGSDCEGCCSPNGIVETLLAEIRQLPLFAALADLTMPCSQAASVAVAARAGNDASGRDDHLQTLDSMPNGSAGIGSQAERQSQAQTLNTTSSSDLLEDMGAHDGQRQHGNVLLTESLCMLILLVPTASWRPLADAKVLMRIAAPHDLMHAPSSRQLNAHGFLHRGGSTLLQPVVHFIACVVAAYCFYPFAGNFGGRTPARPRAVECRAGGARLPADSAAGHRRVGGWAAGWGA